MPAQPIDLDVFFAQRTQDNVDHATVVPILLNEQEWHLTNTASQAALFNTIRDPMAYVKRMVIPDERDAFEQMLLDWEGLDQDAIIELINKLQEVIAGGVPTVPSTASSATSRSRTSSTRSRET